MHEKSVSGHFCIRNFWSKMTRTQYVNALVPAADPELFIRNDPSANSLMGCLPQYLLEYIKRHLFLRPE